MADVVGTFRQYESKRFSVEAMQLVEVARKITESYEARGYALTLRGLYYQFITRNVFPNSEKSYDLLQRLVNDARLAGLISWTAIEDRERPVYGTTTYDDPAQVMRAARESFKRDLWANQPVRPEVWVEKNGMIGIIGPICEQLRVDYMSCKGYSSQSAQWRAGRRLARYVTKGQRPIVFHLGDHDPSGLDMTRDNRDRVSLFTGVPVQVVRLALNKPQVEQYQPPPNPAKLSDSRAPAYVAEHGTESWELDALTPEVLHEVIEQAVIAVRDPDKWDAALAAEAADLDKIDRWLEELD